MRNTPPPPLTNKKTKVWQDCPKTRYLIKMNKNNGKHLKKLPVIQYTTSCLFISYCHSIQQIVFCVVMSYIEYTRLYFYVSQCTVVRALMHHKNLDSVLTSAIMSSSSLIQSFWMNLLSITWLFLVLRDVVCVCVGGG